MSTRRPVFVSGPHGSGKTTLIKQLLERYSHLVRESDFEIDFLADFPSIAMLMDAERCMVRLYHRIYMMHYANASALASPEQHIIVSRSIHDSFAYIHTYHELGWISTIEFRRLMHMIKSLDYKPHTIVLNPEKRVIKERLSERIKERSRSTRDQVFGREDTDDFIFIIHRTFSDMQDTENILYIEDNGEDEILSIISWLNRIPLDFQTEGNKSN